MKENKITNGKTSFNIILLAIKIQINTKQMSKENWESKNKKIWANMGNFRKNNKQFHLWKYVEIAIFLFWSTTLTINSILVLRFGSYF